MNEIVIRQISEDLNLKENQVTTVLKLLEEGNTVPFIARYRKEVTGALDEEMIRKICEVYDYQVNLAKRKEDVIRLIEEKDMMTEELRTQILACQKLVEVEDLYRPYKEKKKTKATEAIALGLEPLAKKMMSFPMNGTIESFAKPYVNDKVTTVLDAVTGAKYIIAEWISDHAGYRKFLRNNIYKNGMIVSSKKKKTNDDLETYKMYYDYQEAVRSVKPHRILAMNRGEKEGILTISLDVDTSVLLSYLEKKIIKQEQSFVTPFVKEAIQDSYKRLIFPSIEREIRSDLKEKSEEVAIDNFSKNVEKLLLTPPMKGKMVLGLDPAFRTGCKLAVLDKTGKPLEIAVIYPTEPRCEIEASKKKVLELIERYQIDLIAIGNGTASRESEQFIANTIKEASRKVEYMIVSEAGASVYSASKLAIEEFPDLTVEKRSAISIGRRLQDALAELVKIDPKSIGVGLYQHDMTQKRLDESLRFVVTKVVNQVGVNINTASRSLLEYVSGLNKKAIQTILAARDERGKFTSRKEIQQLKGISKKQFEQSIGFMRILDGTNPLDKTDIHPESYSVALALLQELGFSIDQVGSRELNEVLKDIDIDFYTTKLKTDRYTLEDIVASLQKPGRDLRDSLPKPLLKSDILHLEDLKIGMKLQGTVRNVVDFGAFIDVGLHDDGLAHISKLSNQYIRHPLDVVNVGDIVDCYVIGINLDTKKLSLSLLPPENIMVPSA